MNTSVLKVFIFPLLLRRAGDPGVLVGSAEKAIRELHWKPEFNSLEKIIQTAWNWHTNNPKGYTTTKAS